MKVALLLVTIGALSVGTANAQEKVSVKALTGDGYAVVSSFMTNIGPAIFLQKAGNLYLCFVTERPDTPEIITNYCKPVR